MEFRNPEFVPGVTKHANDSLSKGAWHSPVFVA